MSKEEVFQYIRDEQDKYADARREAKIKRLKEGKLVSNKTSSWAVMLPIGLGIGIIIVVITYFVLGFFIEEYQIPKPEPSQITVLAQFEGHEIYQSNVFQDINENWEARNYAAVNSGVDEIVTLYPEEEELTGSFHVLKLESYVLNEQYSIAAAYAQNLQSRYASHPHLISEILWFRGYATYQMEQYLESFRSYQMVYEMGGEKSETAYRNARYLFDEKL